MKQEPLSKALPIADEEIVERVLKGEKELFEKLMRKFNLRLYRIGMAIINDDKAVEDVMQTAYLNAYLHLADFQKEVYFQHMAYEDSDQRKLAVCKEKESTKTGIFRQP